MNLMKTLTKGLIFGSLGTMALSSCDKNKTFHTDLNGDGKKDKVTIYSNKGKINVKFDMSDPMGRFDIIYCQEKVTNKKFNYDCAVVNYVGKNIRIIQFKSNASKGYKPGQLYVSLRGNKTIDKILK